jgi:hypothetical protein
MTRAIHFSSRGVGLLLAGFLLGFLQGLPEAFATETLVELKDIRSDEILTVGFELPKAIEVTVEGVGLRLGSSNRLAAFAWLLDANTRKTVWVMERRNRDRTQSSGDLVTVEEKLQLPAGRYELYMAALNRWNGGFWDDGDHQNLGDVFSDLGNMFGKKGSKEFDRQLRTCYVAVTSDQLDRHAVTTFEVTGERPHSLIRFAPMGDDEYKEQGFELTQPSTVIVYAVVEVPDKTAVDRAWITNADTHVRVWETLRRNTEHAGGGDKNRMAEESLKLDKGRYVLHFASDDSHSWEYFNSRPPFDPMNWGVTLLPGAGFQASAFKLFEPTARGDALVDLTRARNDAYLEQAFKLKKETSLYVRCVGEYSDWGDEFADYGSIQNATTGEVVFEMTAANTTHAGGAEKNKVFEGVVTLPAGSYLASYATDDSHAYRDWNSSAPYEPEAWGLAVFPGPGYHAGDLELVTESTLDHEGDVLVRMVRVGDDEHRRATFTLNASTRVQIVAVGEGQDGDMADFGWIENRKTGRTVWEMTWRNTRHAGGAEKNRIFDGQITLDAGEYEVFYESDGSHSFEDWNDTKPRNASQWGITVSKAGAS